VQRIAALLERYGARFTGRVFTEQELVACNNRVERMASRFAAKEAVSKAFGTGIGPVSWREIEVISDDAGQPELVLTGRAARLAQDLGLSTWTISLSHTEEQAIAFVIAAG
jgi:holo-[acyl-carrier protein] synthase